MRRPLAALISFAQRLAAGQVVLSIESVVLLASLFFALFCNSLFLSGMLDGYDMAQPGSWLLGASLLVVLAGRAFRAGRYRCHAAGRPSRCSPCSSW